MGFSSKDTGVGCHALFQVYSVVAQMVKNLPETWDCQFQIPNLSFPPFPCGNHKFVFEVCEAVSVL